MWIDSNARRLSPGRLLRPGGFRGVDFILQDYEGTVTIRPSWGIREMGKFLSNFDEERVAQCARLHLRPCYISVVLRDQLQQRTAK